MCTHMIHSCSNREWCRSSAIAWAYDPVQYAAARCRQAAATNTDSRKDRHVAFGIYLQQQRCIQAAPAQFASHTVLDLQATIADIRLFCERDVPQLDSSPVIR